MKSRGFCFLQRWLGFGVVLLTACSGVAVKAQTNHTLVAHYTFDDGLPIMDTSGNGNTIYTIQGIGSGRSLSNTNDAKVGPYAEAFGTGVSNTAAVWLIPPTNTILPTIAGSFTLSLWLKTSDTYGNNTDPGFLGEGIVAAFNGSGSNTVIPMAITGSKLAFFTGGSPQDTLHSATSINTHQYVHLAVTRNQATGAKRIYINGVLDASDTSATNQLNSPTEMDIGANSGSGKGIDGEMDDVQLYSRVLTDSEIAVLYSNPGSTVLSPVSPFSLLNPQLAGTNFQFSFQSQSGHRTPSFTVPTSAAAPGKPIPSYPATARSRPSRFRSPIRRANSYACWLSDWMLVTGAQIRR